MGHYRSKNLFFLLMAIAFVVTFMLPARVSSRLRPQLGILFAPVSRPAAGIARMIGGRTLVVNANDHRTDDNIRLENDRLRAENSRLSALVSEASRRDIELAGMGDLAKDCVLAEVAGADTSGRESITLVGRSLLNVKPGMYALTRAGLAGRIDAVSAGSAQLRLITDPGVRLRCRFDSFSDGAATPVALSPVVVEGRGDGLMVVRQLTLTDLRVDASMKPLDPNTAPVLHEGDYCTLDDPDCPLQLQGFHVGRVVSIDPRPGGRLFAEVKIRPMMNLKRLPEAMILMKEK
jgi:cell shape-determining protein MreC